LALLMSNGPSKPEAAFGLRMAYSAHTERMEAISDAATLAAEQVQDKRIELLEGKDEGSALTVSSFVMSGLLSLVVGPVAGALLQKAANSIVVAVLRAMAVAPDIGRATTATQIRAIWDKRPKLETSPDLQKAAVEYTDKVVGGVTAAATKQNFVALATASGKIAQQLRQGKGLGQEPVTDSVGVAFRAAVADFASNQRILIGMWIAHIEQLMETNVITPALALELADLSGVQVNGRDVALVEIRDRCRLLYEALLWARMFGFGSREIEITGGRTVDEELQYEQKQPLWIPDTEIPSALSDYWLERLINPRTNQRFSALRESRGVDRPTITNLERPEDAFMTSRHRERERDRRGGDKFVQLRVLRDYLIDLNRSFTGIAATTFTVVPASEPQRVPARR
jgi:hypothetical protein